MTQGLNAGKLRHRITIEQPVHGQNPATGEIVTTWISVAENISAAIEPLSVREFIAAQATQSKVSARIVIRYRTGLSPAMRITTATGSIYNILGILPDADSGREYLTMACVTC
ncbi:phage head closure protein [Denitromonas halophila]|uniref:Head-tail adaptor protein n=1 Tax=Denitromonas halophila TaxID=1629404 RepID=A0A557QJS8_9RHOO|nr:phage head closure protein [Denitromonas halophila]TVO53163.1 head-tail adaptor protein [Denitromonas halophila]